MKLFGGAAFGAILACVGLQASAADNQASAVFNAVLNSEARKAAIASIDAQGRMITIAQGDRRAQVTAFADVGLERVDNPGSLSVADNNDTKLSRIVGVDVQYNLLDGMRTHNRIFREATLMDAEIIRLSDA